MKIQGMILVAAAAACFGASASDEPNYPEVIPLDIAQRAIHSGELICETNTNTGTRIFKETRCQLSKDGWHGSPHWEFDLAKDGLHPYWCSNTFCDRPVDESASPVHFIN